MMYMQISHTSQNMSKGFIFNVILLKVFMEFVIILLLFHVLVFWPQCMWDRLGMESTLLALEAQVLTAGLPGESLHGF